MRLSQNVTQFFVSKLRLKLKAIRNNDNYDINSLQITSNTSGNLGNAWKSNMQNTKYTKNNGNFSSWKSRILILLLNYGDIEL